MPGAFLLWIGMAALGAGCFAVLFNLGFAAEVGLFALLASILVALALRLRRRRSAGNLNTRESGLLGRAAIVISFRGREGRVRVGDSEWPARLPPGVPAPAAGEVLTIIGVEGTTVLVHRAHEEQA